MSLLSDEIVKRYVYREGLYDYYKIHNAEIKKAEGEKTAAILRAEGRAQEIKLVQQQLTQSPNYIELVKWKGYADGKGSPFGENNVFGAGTSVIKGLK